MKYLLFLLIAFRSNFTICQIKKPKIHLLLLADVENVDFGEYSQSDNSRIAELMNSMARHLNYNIDYIDINHKNFSSAGFYKALKSISIQPSDIVMLYYSGFGAKNPKSGYPFLIVKDFKKTKFSLDQAADSILVKKPAQCIVIADTRDKFFGKTARGEGVPGLTGIEKDITKSIVKNIFSNNNKLVKIASANKNERSIIFTDMADKGSFFTICLRNSMAIILDKTTENELSKMNFGNWLNKTQELMNFEYAKEKGSVLKQTIQHNLK